MAIDYASSREVLGGLALLSARRQTFRSRRRRHHAKRAAGGYGGDGRIEHAARSLSPAVYQLNANFRQPPQVRYHRVYRMPRRQLTIFDI